MTIPSCREIMLPLLNFLSDNKEHSMHEALDYIALNFDIKADERIKLNPSGRGRKFYHNVAWAKTYLYKARLIEKTAKGCFKINDQGLDVLKENPAIINKTYLQRFREFRTFSKSKI